LVWKAVFGALAAISVVVASPAVAAPAAAAEAPAAPDWVGRTPTDPNLRTGVLPNGLRYAVMRSATPKGAVSIRFAIDVGSYEETEAERGLAHFVEHMAFRATTHFPEGRLEQQLAEIGVGAGRDHNAFTGLYSTLYVIDLPDGGRDHLDLAFRWLRDVAEGVVFDPVAVDHERGVILAEKEARGSNDQTAEDRIGAFQAQGLRSQARAPIGLESVLRSAGPQELRRFHARWYRPDTAVIAIAGDLPTEAMETWIRTAFSTWTAEGPPPVRAVRGAPDVRRGLDAMSLEDARLDDRLRICRLQPAEPLDRDDAEHRRRVALRNLWLDILDQRLLTRADRDGEMVDGMAWTEAEDRDLRRVCLQAAPNPGGWEPALIALQSELRRLRRDGPTEAEMEAALERARADLRGGVSTVETQPTTDLADEIVQSLLDRTPFADPRVLMSAYGRAVEDLTPADLREAIARDWAGAGPLIDALGTAPPSRTALLAAWTAAEAEAEPPAYVDPPRPKWAYADFGEPGRVARREAQPDFVRITFRNGVVLNVKSTSFAKETAEVRVVLGDGRLEIAPADLYRARLAASLLRTGGLGRQSWRETDMALAPIDWDFNLWIGDRAFTLAAAPMTSNLLLQLQVLAAYVSDPGFRPQPAARLKSVVDQSYRDLGADPGVVAASAVYQVFAPDSGQAPPPRETLGTLSSADIDRLLRAPLTTSPMEVTIVGDLDEKTAIDLVARTFGALPPRKPANRQRTDIAFLALPDQAPAPLRLSHQGPADKAMVSLTWPLFRAGPKTRREEVVAELLADILTDALTREVRDRQGRTYTPNVTALTPDEADQGLLQAQIETYPADAERVRLDALRVAADLARTGPSAAQLEAARKPALSGYAAALQTNTAWADRMAGSTRFPHRAEDLRLLPRLTAEVGLEEVRAAAARWLSPQPIQVVVTPGPKEAP